jgi:hypothetical protein
MPDNISGVFAKYTANKDFPFFRLPNSLIEVDYLSCFKLDKQLKNAHTSIGLGTALVQPPLSVRFEMLTLIVERVQREFSP